MLTTLLSGRAFAERHGSAPARVVALHGWGRTRADWHETLAGYDALALDLPGFGSAPEPPSGWSTAEYADWLAEVLLDAVPGEQRPVVVGHSFGGRVALQLAARRPELLSGMVLTGVPLLRRAGAGRPATRYRVARWLHRRGLLGEARMDALREQYGSVDYRAARGVMREVLVRAVTESYDDQLAALAMTALPVTMVWGELDTAAPVDMARRAAEIAGAQLTVVPGSAHLLDPALVAALRGAADGMLEAP